jgi:hypothetical protein
LPSALYVAPSMRRTADACDIEIGWGVIAEPIRARSRIAEAIGIGGASRLRPSRKTVRTGPCTAAPRIEPTSRLISRRDSAADLLEQR